MIKDKGLGIFREKYMLAKSNRLAKERDVKVVSRTGRTFHDHRLAVKFARSRGPARFTVVVSTKVSKHAVKRNRIKRLIREYIRLHMRELVTGDYMILVRPVVARFTASEVLGTIEEVFRKARLLQPKD